MLALWSCELTHNTSVIPVWSLPCNSRQKSSYSLHMHPLVPKVTSSQPSLSEKSQFSNMISIGFACPSFSTIWSLSWWNLQGVREELTFLLASLMLHNLLSFCSSFEQLLHRPSTLLLQARSPFPQPQSWREATDSSVQRSANLCSRPLQLERSRVCIPRAERLSASSWKR